MRVVDDLYVEWVKDEAVVLNRGSGELHYLNGPAALVFALIQEEGYEKAVAEVVTRFGLDPAEGELHALLGDLADSGLLIDGTAPPADQGHAPAHAEPRAPAG